MAALDPYGANGGVYIQNPNQFVPTIQTSGTTNIYYPQVDMGVVSPTPEPEPGPLDWLREQVDEVCELAAVA